MYSKMTDEERDVKITFAFQQLRDMVELKRNQQQDFGNIGSLELVNLSDIDED